MSDAAAQTVLSFYSFPPGMVRRIESLGNAGGWSGSLIWKVELAASAVNLPTGSAVGNALRGVPGAADSPQFLCLRRWPREHPTPERLRMIHDVLDRVWHGGLHVIPRPLRTSQGTTFVEHEGHLWELTPWMPGIADYHAAPSRERLRGAMQTLARFHLLSARVVTDGVVPALVNRRDYLKFHYLDQCARLKRSLATARQRGRIPGAYPALDARFERMVALCQQRLPQLYDKLVAAAQTRLPRQPAIRDIWHDHVLFTGDEVTGIVDFGALNVDTPLTDIARLVGSLVGDDVDARGFAMDAYAELRPLSQEDRQLIDLLDESGQVVAAVNWPTWLYVDRRDMGPVEPIIRRLDEILQRLEHLAAR